MYHNYYQLKENPFNVTADPDFFFSSKCHGEAISNLLYGIEQRKGIIVMTGEIGTGKTTLCRKLLKQSSENIKFALVLNPKCSETQLLQQITHDLGIETKKQTRFGLVHTLNEFLIAETRQGNNVVVVIDEAQQMSVNQLEQIRLLSNLETEKEKLLQIVLVGQPELHDKLKLPALRQLRQRIAIHFHIQALNKEDIKSYIHHRLAIARSAPRPQHAVVFTEAAIENIFRFSHGSPRTINIICDRALMAGFVAETFTINESMIEHCAKEILYCEYH